MPAPCSSCGAPVSGRFCAQCGAPAGAFSCGACGKEAAAGARFCDGCGAALAGVAVPRGAGSLRPVAPPAPAAAGGSLMPVVLAGVAVVAAIMVFVLRSQPAAPPIAAAGAPFASGGGAPPDLSTMTPREQFLRLHDRIMTAMEQGDTATFQQFTPMALMAYQNLPEVDPDVRYHAATLRLHSGDQAGARALTDSLVAADPTHLFGYMLRAALARFGGDPAGTTAAYRGYLASLEAELRKGRPEYLEHQQMLDRFTQSARAEAAGR